jgi:hypothetical protein
MKWAMITNLVVAATHCQLSFDCDSSSSSDDEDRLLVDKSKEGLPTPATILNDLEMHIDDQTIRLWGKDDGLMIKNDLVTEDYSISHPR